MLTRPEGMHEQMTTLDAERVAQGVRNTLHSVIPRLKDLHNTLLEPAKVSDTPITLVCVPRGFKCILFAILLQSIVI